MSNNAQLVSFIIARIVAVLDNTERAEAFLHFVEMLDPTTADDLRCGRVTGDMPVMMYMPERLWTAWGTVASYAGWEITYMGESDGNVFYTINNAPLIYPMHDRIERLNRLLAEPEGTVTPLSTSAVKYHTDTGLLTPMMSTDELEEKLERMKEQSGFYGPTGDDFEEYLDD